MGTNREKLVKLIKNMAVRDRVDFCIFFYELSDMSEDGVLPFKEFSESPAFKSATAVFKQGLTWIFNDFQATCIGAGNSKVIKLESWVGEDPFILKLTPSAKNTELVIELKQSELRDLFLDSDVNVSVKISDETVDLVLEDDAGQDLENYFKTKRDSGSFSDSEAISIYSNMAQALKRMVDFGIFHPDAKNSNWQFKDGKLILADTKSIVKIGTKPNTYSPHACPKEFLEGLRELTAEDVEKMHVYELGINMIECFSGESVESTEKPTRKNLMSIYPLYQESRNKLLNKIQDGKLKTLLEACVADDPRDRPSLEEVILKLQLIESNDESRISHSTKWKKVMEGLKKSDSLKSGSSTQFKAALEGAKTTQASNGTSNDPTNQGPNK